jgi:hypothetical protein
VQQRRKRYTLAVAFKKRESLNIAAWSLPLELYFMQPVPATGELCVEDKFWDGI